MSRLILERLLQPLMILYALESLEFNEIKTSTPNCYNLNHTFSSMSWDFELTSKV